MKIQLKFILLSIILLTFFGLINYAHASNAPVVLYTDLASGPTTGGENNKGTYLSIFGKNFGASAGNVSVTIGNVAVDHVISLGTSKGRSDIQQIIVQVGALTGLNQGTAYSIKVTVSSTSSNTDVTFMPNPGRIIFASLSGNDSTGAVNDIAHPYRHVQTSNWPSGTSALSVAQPGDVIVMRAGTWTDAGYDNYFCKFRYKSGSAPTGASGHGPIAIISYPGEDVYINNSDTSGFNGGISGLNRMNYPDDSDWITIAGLRVRSDSYDGPMNLQVMADHWRVVNNDLSDQTSGTAKSGGIAGNGAYLKIYGNKIHDINGNTMENHGIYFDGGTNQANPLIEIAYNDINNVNGGSCFQIYNVGTNGPNQSGDSVNVRNFYFHHNKLTSCGKYGINIADGSGDNIRVYNNIVTNTVAYGLRFNCTCPYDSAGNGCNGLSNFKFYNNTLYNVGTNTSYNYSAITNEWDNASAGQIDIRNNIFIPYSSRPYLGGAYLGSGALRNNLWYGSGTAPADDTAAINSNPLFVTAGTDFHLQSASPAKDAGSSLVSSIATNDYDVTIARPQNSVYDIGAYEYSSGSALQGDLNSDNTVNIFDYNILLANFGSAQCGNAADIDGNCNVNIFDYNILLSHFGESL